MKKVLTKLVALSATAMLALTPAYAQEEKAPYSLKIDGEVMNAEVYEDNGTIFIPLRAICEKLGFNVTWEEATRSVILEKLPVYVTFSADEDGYSFARTARMLLGHAPKIINDRTYVPSNFIDEILQGTIDVSENEIDIKWTVLDEEAEENEYINVTFIEKDEEGRFLVNNFLRGDMLLNITDETIMLNAGEDAVMKVTADELNTENEWKVKLSDAMTMSIPPQVNALEIIATNNLAPVQKSGVISEIVENDGTVEQIVLGNKGDKEGFFAVNVSDETKAYNLNGEEIKLSELKEGMRIDMSVSAFSTKSIPEQFSCYAIRLTTVSTVEISE